MLVEKHGVTRRDFIKSSIAAVGAATLPFGSVTAQNNNKAKYTRYNVMSEGGKRALASYARGVQAMLNLPADHPQNWFRNAFIHLMDCPHGNWWFYVWHRGYLGYFEQTIRALSKDETFAMPYWDWTTLPQIPDPMFDGVLNPQDRTFEPYTKNLAVFTRFVKPALSAYWNTLTTAQLAQLRVRNYTGLDKLWNDVTGFDPSVPPNGAGISGNMAYAITCGSRYLTRDNPKLDANTAKDVSPDVICSGLAPREFNSTNLGNSFTSPKTPSHNSPPAGFSTLEGFPHNKVHNYIGGVGPVDPGPYGNMTNFLSPVDPIFFLHHSNMDRLWDVWTRKQQRRGLPYLPTGQDLITLSDEPFLFYVNGSGQYVANGKAGDYLSTEKFDYDYEPGFGETCIPLAAAALQAKPKIKATVKGNEASATVPTATIKTHLATEAAPSLVAEITLPHPGANSSEREFDVIVGGPPDAAQVSPESPFFAGTIAFFGHMMNMTGAHDVTFVVPLPKTAEAFHNLGAANATVNIRLVPRGPGQKAAVLRAVTVDTR